MTDTLSKCTHEGLKYSRKQTRTFHFSLQHNDDNHFTHTKSYPFFKEMRENGNEGHLRI